MDRLEQFWQNLVLTFPAARVVDGAVMACNPELPMPQCNHAANIKVDEDEAEDLLKRVTSTSYQKALLLYAFELPHQLVLQRSALFLRGMDSRRKKKSQ